MNLLIGATGSVATIKLAEIIQLLRDRASAFGIALQIRVVATPNALSFLALNQRPPDVPFFTDTDEWTQWTVKGDPVLHIELRKWADAFVILPLGANSLAKLANGMCDNLLTCVARAWNPERFDRMMAFPAMNTFMWNHPVTAEHLRTLQNWGINVVLPISKTLACGDTGIGGLPSSEAVVKSIFDHLVELGHRKND